MESLGEAFERDFAALTLGCHENSSALCSHHGVRPPRSRSNGAVTEND